MTSTLAWFRVSDTLIASNIAIDYVSQEDFSIGLKKDEKVDYYQKVDSTILQDYFPSYDSKEHLNDVSSMYQSQWLNEKTVFANTVPLLRTGFGPSSSRTMTDVAKGGFLQFDMLLHSDRNMYVFLSETTTLKADTAANSKIADLTGINVDDLNKVEDCLRISFYTDNGFFIYEPNVDTSSNTSFADRLNLNALTSQYYQMDDDKKEVLFGDYNYDDPNLNLIYDEESRASVPAAGKLTGFNAGTNPEAVGGLDIAKSISEGNLSITHEKTYTLKELSNAVVPQEGVPSYPLTLIDAGVDKRIVVTLYIEGWDRDVVDSIGWGVFDLNLAFKGLYVNNI